MRRIRLGRAGGFIKRIGLCAPSSDRFRKFETDAGYIIVSENLKILRLAVTIGSAVGRFYPVKFNVE